MRILYIAGFFAPTLEQLRASLHPYVDERSVVLIGQRPDRQLDVNALKTDLFDQLTQGCERIHICIFAFRKQPHVLKAVHGVVIAAQRRFPATLIQVQPFQNAQDYKGLLREVENFSPTRNITFPPTIDSLEDWFALHFPTTIIFHPRALRGAKESQYLDNQKIYAALSLLAREYARMRTTPHLDAARANGTFMNKLLELGLELAPSISPTRAGEQGEDYTVPYPIGSMKKRTLDLHLKLGSDRDQRYCLRIYFFWDEDMRKVVIGWLPSHLGTRSS